MARCEKVILQPVKLPAEYHLVLNEAEAQFLSDILGRVGGDPKTTRRALGDDLYNALRVAGGFVAGGSDMSENIRCHTRGR